MEERVVEREDRRFTAQAMQAVKYVRLIARSQPATMRAVFIETVIQELRKEQPPEASQGSSRREAGSDD